MYANLGPGQTIELDEPSPSGVELLYSHEYVAERMRNQPLRQQRVAERTFLYAYVANNPVNRIDPSGLKCEVAVHCRNAYAGSFPIGTHCGLTINDNTGTIQLDGRGGRVGFITQRPNPEDGPVIVEGQFGQKVGTFRSYSDNVCECLRGYPAIFNAAKLPRGTLAGNSNWALNCMVNNCGIGPIDWGSWKVPDGYFTPPCKRSEEREMFSVSFCVCIERWACPGGKGQDWAKPGFGVPPVDTGESK